MADIHPGRTTHAHDGSLVLFQIGMRVNQPWRPDLWGPVFAAMPSHGPASPQDGSRSGSVPRPRSHRSAG